MCSLGVRNKKTRTKSLLIKCCVVQHCGIDFNPSSTNCCPSSLSISSSSDLSHPAEACVNPYRTAVHRSWVAMATHGPKFCGATSIPRTISCVSRPSLTPPLTQQGVEVRNWLRRHTCWRWLYSTSDSISGLTISAPQASCRDCELEEASSSNDLLETFCRSDFGEFQ